MTDGHGVVVVGSSNVDMVVQVARAPEAGETVLCDTYIMAPGGKGANQAVAAARMGASVVFIACLGQDAAGVEAREGFRQEGIDVEHVDLLDGVVTGTAFIWVDGTGENRIVVASGANSRLLKFHIEKAAGAIQHAHVLLCQLETPVETVQAALGIAHRAGVRTILNPAPARPLDDRLLEMVDILTPNQGEAASLLGLPSDTAPDTMSGRLLERGTGTVLMTLGAQGVLLHEAGSMPQHILAPQVDVVDTTAAGDVFNGALAALLAEGQSLEQTALLAVRAASLACTRLGARPSIPRREDLS